MGVSDGKLCLSEKKIGKIWMDYIERIVIEEDDLDHVEGVAVEGPVVCEAMQEELQALN